MNKYRSLLQVISKPARLKMLLSFNHKGYLQDTGWFSAFESRSAVDGQGQSIPWVTYAFIDFIRERIKKEHAVFEFGSGNSTLFYARYAGIVVSVEHDREWYDKIHREKPENAELIYCELQRDGEYCRMPVRLKEQFDIIIVDGRDRVNCCRHALEALTARGVVVLDDSERENYRKGVDLLLKAGFRQIAFTGISPGLFYRKATSVFYRDQNCLGI